MCFCAAVPNTVQNLRCGENKINPARKRVQRCWKAPHQPSECCAPREQVVQAVRSHSAQRSASGLSVVADHVRSQTCTVVYFRRKILLTKGMMENYCNHRHFIFV